MTGCLEFSLNRDGGCGGKVRIEAAGEEAFLCAPELMKTLSESLCDHRGFLAAGSSPVPEKEGEPAEISGR